MIATVLVQVAGGSTPLLLNVKLPDFSGSDLKIAEGTAAGCDGSHGGMLNAFWRGAMWGGQGTKGWRWRE